MAELVDAHASGACVLMYVEVQVLLSAQMMKIGIIGLGSMGSSVLQAILSSAQNSPEIAASVHFPRSQANAERFKVQTFSENAQLVEFADLVILAVKPKDIANVLAPLKGALKGKALLSVAAGVGYKDFAEMLDVSTRVMVTLPNLALTVGAGVVGIAEETTFTDVEREFVEAVFSQSARLVYVPSALLGTLSSLSGSGPAFLALVAQSMIDAGVKQGLQRDVAAQIVNATFTGTGSLLEKTFPNADALKSAVCSPGGTSIVGVASLEQSGVPGSFIEAIDKTTARFDELSSS